MAIKSLKTNEYYIYPLFFNYQLEPPEVSSTLKLKGNLRISWAFDMQYNKSIDLIFFPEENPYINYALLFARDFEKSIDKNASIERELSDITIPYNINYDFVKEILSQSDLSVMQQERFFEVRFGSVFVPMEIEFEGYSYGYDYNAAEFAFLNFDPNLIFNEWNDIPNILCLGIIQSYQVLSKEIALNFPPSVENWNYDSIEGSFSYSELFTPLPTAALATTKTNIGDYLVNVRDKPDSKEGKIVTQLLSQEISPPSNFCLSYGNHGCDEVNPLYQEMVDKGREWYKEDDKNFTDEDISALEYYHYKAGQLYYEKEKGNLIHPLNEKEYLILVWNIDSKDWAKVWILKMPNKKSVNPEGETFEELREHYSIADSVKEVISSYAQTFLESPSKLKLYEGYIHCSGLQYYIPFSENYIKR